MRAGFYDLPFVQDHDLVGVAEAVVAERARKSQNRFLSQVDKLIDWDKVRKVIEKKYKKRENAVGGKAYDCVLLFKILLLETWYNLSDPAVAERINDSITFPVFSGSVDGRDQPGSFDDQPFPDGADEIGTI